MKNLFLSLLAVAGMTAGIVLLQSSGYPPRAHAATSPAEHEQRLLGFLTSHLDLTNAQQQQAKTIFDAARAQAMPLVAQLKKGHDALAAGIKAGQPDSELDRLAAQQGTLIGQLSAIHAKAASQFYAMLTPDQKTKADKLHQLVGDVLRSHLGGLR